MMPVGAQHDLFNEFSAHPRPAVRPTGEADASPRRCGREPLNPTGVIAARERQEPGADIRRDGGERPAKIDGRGRRDTSRAAYGEQVAGGKVRGAQARITAFLEARRGQGFTRAEIAKAIGMPLSGVCGRVNELVHIKGVLEEMPRRACSVSGKAAHPVRVA